MNFDNFPTTLRSFERRFPTDVACEAYLFSRRFPDGFVCKKCGSTATPWHIASKHCLLECRDCGKQVSLTSGTVFENTKKPLKDWFWALFEVAVHKTGCSAAHLCRVLGFSELTGLNWMRKLRAVTVNPEREPLSGEVEADTIFFNVQDEEGKGVEVPVAVAIEVKRNIDKFGNEHAMPGRARLGVLQDQSAG
jgi:transposase-like protein